MKSIDSSTGVFVGAIGTAIFAIIVAIYTFRGSLDQDKKSVALSGKVDYGNLLGQDNRNLITDLQKINKQLDRQVKVLRQQNDSLRKTSKLISDNITGGNSSCYLEFIPNESDAHAYVFLKQEGEFPLREVEIHIRDTNTKAKYAKRYTIVKVSRHRKFVMKVPFNKGNTNLFAIFISSFNNSWNQQVVIEPATSSSRGLLFESVFRVYRLQEQITAGKWSYDYTLIKEGRMPGRDGLGNLGMRDWTPYSQHLLETDLVYDWEIK